MQDQKLHKNYGAAARVHLGHTRMVSRSEFLSLSLSLSLNHIAELTTVQPVGPGRARGPWTFDVLFLIHIHYTDDPCK